MQSSARFNRFVLVLIFNVVSISGLQAAEKKQQFGPWVWGFSGGAVHQFDADLSDADGDFNVSRGFAQASFGYAWDQRTSVSLSLGAGSSNYDFSPRATIDGQPVWDKIEDYRISLPVRFAPTENTNVILIPSVRTSNESGASLNSGRTEGLIGGIRGTLSLDIKADQQIGANADQFPKDEDHCHVTGDNDPQHAETEKGKVLKKTGIASRSF